MSQENLSLLKALDVLDLFSKDNVEYRLSEIANLLNMRSSTTSPDFAHAGKAGLYRTNPSNGKYLLGVVGLCAWAAMWWHQMSCVDAALPPHIAELASKYQATSPRLPPCGKWALCFAWKRWNLPL